MRDHIAPFLMGYQFGIREIETKLTILRDGFLHLHGDNPVEHVTSRVESIEGIFDTVLRKQIPTDLDSIRANILPPIRERSSGRVPLRPSGSKGTGVPEVRLLGGQPSLRRMGGRE